MTSNKEATIFSTWSTAVVVKGLSALYSRRLRLCRDGVVCLFVRVELSISRAVWARSKQRIMITCVLKREGAHISFVMISKWVQLLHKVLNEDVKLFCLNLNMAFFQRRFVSFLLSIIMLVFSVPITSRVKILYIASCGMFTCLDLKQHRRYSPHGQVILDFLLPPYHLFSVLIPHSPEWSLENANFD